MVTGKASTVFGLTINGGFALCGKMAMPMRLRLWITIR